MSLTLQDVINGISNGTINEYVLSEALEELKLSSYHHLYNIQRDMVNIDKFRFYYKDLTEEQDTVFTGDRNYTYKSHILPKSFIYNNYRHKFRHQPYFNKPLTNDIINEHRDIFIYNYLVFVDGKLDTSARICCKEELTEICLNEKYMVDENRDKFKPGCTIDVIFLKHSYFISVDATKSAMVHSEYKIKMNGIYTEPTDRIFAFINKDNGAPRVYETTINENNECCVDSNCGLQFNDTETMHINLLIVNNICERFDVPKTLNFIQNKYLNMPLPKMNTLVFDKCENGEIRFNCSNDILSEKYPDIFQIKSDRVVDNIIYTLYYENEANSNMVFDRDTNYYSKLINILDKYNKNTVSSVLANYNPLDYKYDLNDYHISEFNNIEFGPLIYKANKLNVIFKLWAYVLELYKSKEMDLSGLGGYYLDLTGKEISGKLRFNNYNEITVPANKDTFDEPRYLFTYKTDDLNTKLPYKFFIDGVLYNPDKLYIENGYQYVYIPQKLIKPTSVIEIERSRNLSFKVQLDIADKPIPLRFPSDDIKCPFTSVFLVDAENNYVSDGNYQIYTTINGVKTILDKKSTMTVSNDTNMYIQAISDDATFKTIYAMCNDVPSTFNKEINLNNYMDRNLNTEGNIHNIKPDENRIRIFKHGLLIPKEKYKIVFPENINDNVNIGLDFDKYINTFNIDYIPEGYHTVYGADEIDKSGIINLEGIINKPFSLKYYDVYLNGYRLNKRQIEKITNFTIRVKDVKTIRKLYIYEKDTGLETYKFGGEHNLLSDILLKEDPEFMAKLLQYVGEISVDPTIIDVDTMFDVIENLLVGLITDYLEFSYVDCNLDEIPDEIYNKYTGFFKSDMFYIDCNTEYQSGDSDEKLVYYIAPQSADEIFSINDPYYVNEFNDLMASFTERYVDANADVDLTEFKNYPSVIAKDDIIMVDGSKNIDRFADEEDMLLG